MGEELLNSISHGIGTLLGIAGTVLLLINAVLFTVPDGGYDVFRITASAVYGFSLILLYSMSTLYHAITNERAKNVFQVLDHSTIFLLIAGTYTPYALVTIQGTLGFVVFGLVWGSAVLGIVLNAISVSRFKKISMILYIASGWAVIIAMKPIYDNIDFAGLILLIIGGVFYTGGIVFYSMKKVPYFHGIWHFFVLSGSLCHFFSIYLYVV